nr:transposase [Pectinatus cerevisiiphilus]
MSRKRKNFTAKFKSDLVLELLKSEKAFNSIATENNIQPNLLRNWKRNFLIITCTNIPILSLFGYY